MSFPFSISLLYWEKTLNTDSNYNLIKNFWRKTLEFHNEVTNALILQPLGHSVSFSRSHFVLHYYIEPLPWLPKSCSNPLSIPMKLPSHSTRGSALVCMYVCSWLGPSGTSASVFLHEAASGKSEARGQQKEKDAHQLSQTSLVFSPLISQLLNILAGGCHSLPVWLRS